MAFRLNRLVLSKIRPPVTVRQISTSQKKNETTGPSTAIIKQSESAPKNWMSYGFHRKDKTQDRQAMHLLLFSTITLGLVGTVFAMMYAPDVNLKDWSQREAFIELRRREQAGLPLVDPNLVNPASIKLPSDEELKHTEIII